MDERRIAPTGVMYHLEQLSHLSEGWMDSFTQEGTSGAAQGGVSYAGLSNGVWSTPTNVSLGGCKAGDRNFATYWVVSW